MKAQVFVTAALLIFCLEEKNETEVKNRTSNPSFWVLFL